jgi:hypothetical protein
MAVPNCFKLVVDEGFITDCIETEGHVLHSTFTTYLPIYSKETCFIALNKMSPVYNDLLKKTKSNWMYLWECLNSYARIKYPNDDSLQNLILQHVLKEFVTECRIQQ